MALISLGDMAQSFMLRRQNLAIKTDLTRLSTELTTGRVADASARVSGDLVPLSGIDAAIARLTAYRTVTTEAALFTGAMQTVLGSVDDMASGISASLLAAASGVTPSLVDSVAADARQRFQSAVSALNTKLGDRTLFGGTQTTGTVTVGADTILQALDTAVAGSTSAADVAAAVAAWFDAPAGFVAQAYVGGGPLAPLSIASGEEAIVDVTAADPAIRSTLKGLAMAALLDRGILAGQPAARRDLANLAGISLLQTQTDRTYLSARLGSVEAQIDAGAARNSAEVMALQIARSNIVAADPFETASRLEETQAQLEKIYAVTARMTRLSLMDYL